jgi:hypothetical protein
MIYASLIIITTATLGYASNECANTREGCKAADTEMEDVEADNMKSSLLQMNLQKIAEHQQKLDAVAAVTDPEPAELYELDEERTEEELPDWAVKVVENKKKLGLLQADLDAAANRSYPTCKDACRAKGGMCMACGPDQAYTCAGCCCFHWPMGPKCPDIAGNSRDSRSPSYTLNFNCQTKNHWCEPQAICGGSVANLKYASMRPLNEVNVKCSWSTCRQCEFCKQATGMGSWARNGAQCRVSGRQPCTR